MIGRWQADEGISPKSQDAGIVNVRGTNHPYLDKLENFFVAISEL
jgi:hypothetical protein